MIISNNFFDRDAIIVAKELLGKVIRVKHQDLWLSAKIIETEAYYIHEKGSHASLGFTEKRAALFMPPGTIYMYYARGGDSLNISCQGEGNAVLIKSAVVYHDKLSNEVSIAMMQTLNPLPGQRIRLLDRLCSGQTLLCKSLNLKVPEWDKKPFNPKRFYIEDVGYSPENIVQATRLGIPLGRDEHLLLRFFDQRYCVSMTRPAKNKERK